jgi:hypothetical protein
MSNAQEAFAMTAVLFGLSFAGIFLFWFAEKFRPGRGPKIPREFSSCRLVGIAALIEERSQQPP